MGDHLDSGTEVVPAPLLLDDGLVDLAGRDVVGAGGVDPGEPLVVAQVEVGLGTIFGDKHLAVLGRAHRARIHVEIRVELAQADLVASRLQKRAKSGGRQTFTQGGDHAAGDENVTGHGRPE